MRFDVTRRDPLRNTIVSSLPDYLPDDFVGNAPTSPATSPVGLDLDDVPNVTAPVKPSGTRKPRGTSPDSSAFAGSDNSDYA